MSNSIAPPPDTDKVPRRGDFDEVTLGPCDVLVLRPRDDTWLTAAYVARLNRQIPPALQGRVLVVSDDLSLTVVRNALSASEGSDT